MKWVIPARRIAAVVVVVTMVISGTGLAAGASARTDTRATTGPEVLATADTPYPFSDDVEDPAANNWLADSPWVRTTADSHGGDASWTDSPGDYYGNDSEVSLALASSWT